MPAPAQTNTSLSLLARAFAATAELSELTVLDLDKDFELIAQIAGQPVERLTTA